MLVHDGAEAWSDACMNLEPMKQTARLQQTQRAFRFGEFFAGYGGFTKMLEELAGETVETMAPQDHYEGWDILSDEGFRLDWRCVRRWIMVTLHRPRRKRLTS